jgi:Fe-S cluster biogenesis protein NfuA/nitrite reductase/ring-hydroxylating ferredoxin subunit
MTAATRSEFELLAERVDAAIASVRKLDPAPQAEAMALKSALEALHKAGLTKIVQKLKLDPRGKELLFELVDIPEVFALFTLHGLVRADLKTRVSRVIEMVRPYMQSHGGDVELVDVSEDTVFLKLAGSCNGCSMSAVTLRNGVEEALKEHVPEITKIEVIPDEPSAAIIPLSSLTSGGQPGGWIDGPHADDLKDGKPFRMDTEKANILIIKMAGRLQAFRNACAHQGLPLDGGMVDLESGTIACPWHGFRYDCMTGECLTAPHAQLESFPLRVENGVIKVRPQ